MSVFNLGWKFHLGDITGAWQKGFDDSGWRDVTLPHDWAVEAPFDAGHSSGTGYLPGGTAYYRKSFNLPESDFGNAITLTFDGVYKNAQVWINGNYLGLRPYGYSTFSFDISEFCVFGSGTRNVIAVKVTHEDIADSRWYTGSGIYRKVTLAIAGREHIKNNGVYFKTLYADKNSAGLCVEISAKVDSECEAFCDIFDTGGARVGGGSALIGVTRVVQPNTGASFNWAEAPGKLSGHANPVIKFSVDNPRLWGVGDPYLYRAVVGLRRGGGVLDSSILNIGIRTFSFDADNGFTLNGINTKLKGVCVHHDAGCLGAAAVEKVWRDRLVRLKNIGANAIRTSHNPPMPELLDLCDEMGFLVIDEAFDEWEGCKNKWWTGHNVYPPKHFGYYEYFPEWHEFDLSAMVLRDRNHPSVIMWSIGNEIDYPNDPYCHPMLGQFEGNNDANKPAAERIYNPDKPNAERLPVVARKLVEIVKKHDDTRPVSAAVALPELSNHTGYSACFDVIGFNYKEHLYDEIHKAHPDWIIFGSENRHGYQEWMYVKDLPYISGQFLWTGIDYLGETRGWPLHGSSAGLLSTSGCMKPKAYHRKSLWTEEPYAKIYARLYGQLPGQAPLKWPYDATVGFRESWNFAGGADVEVVCYTNGGEAELFIDGKSAGVSAVSENTAYWRFTYRPGVVKVVADNGAVNEMHPTSAPVAIQLETEDTEIYADGQDIAIVRVEVVDCDERLTDDATHMISVEVDGGALLGIDNGDHSDTQEYALPHRRTCNGRLVIYARANCQPGVLGIRATSPKLRGDYIKITKKIPYQ